VAERLHSAAEWGCWGGQSLETGRAGGGQTRGAGLWGGAAGRTGGAGGLGESLRLAWRMPAVALADLAEGEQSKKEGAGAVGTPGVRLWAEKCHLGVEVATYSHRAVRWQQM